MKNSRHHIASDWTLTSGVLLGSAGAIAFSGKAVIVKLAYRYGVDAVTLIMYRMLFALPLFLLLSWWAGRGKPSLSARDWKLISGLGFCGYYLASFLDFAWRSIRRRHFPSADRGICHRHLHGAGKACAGRPGTERRLPGDILLALFALLAGALAAVGIYGVMSYTVTQRTREVGIRMALGARRSDITMLVTGTGARLAVAGVAIGVVAALASTQLLSGLLFGVRATDPMTFVLTALVLGAVTLPASYIPSRRAASTDPITALRYD